MKTSKPHIFVVDDNEYSLRQIKRSLENSMPCQVTTFSKAVDAIHHLHLNPDFILSDYNLTGNHESGMNGEQLLIILKQQRPEIPVMMYSSRSSVTLAVRLMKQGAADFINSDSISSSGLFAQKLARMVKHEKEKIHQRLLEKQVMMVAIAIGITFLLTLLIASGVNVAVLPYIVLGFMMLFGGLLFFGSPSLVRQLFPGKKNKSAMPDETEVEKV